MQQSRFRENVMQRGLRSFSKLSITLESQPEKACNTLILNTNLRSLDIDTSRVENPIPSIQKILTNTNLRKLCLSNTNFSSGDLRYTDGVHLQSLSFRLCNVSLADIMKLSQLQTLKLYSVTMISLNEMEKNAIGTRMFHQMEKLTISGSIPFESKWIIQRCPMLRSLHIETHLLEHIRYTDHLECLILESVQCDSCCEKTVREILQRCSRLQVLVLPDTFVEALSCIAERTEPLRFLRLSLSEHPMLPSVVFYERVHRRCWHSEIVPVGKPFGRGSSSKQLNTQKERSTFLEMLLVILQMYELTMDIRVYLSLWCAGVNKNLQRTDKELDSFIRFVNIHLQVILSSKNGVIIFESGHWYLSERVFVPCSRPSKYRIQLK